MSEVNRHGGRESEAIEAPEQRGERRPETEDRIPTPRIYVASLADYNAGWLHGEWIDADQDPNELEAEAKAMLAKSRQPDAEEWAIHDHEGFGPYKVDEYDSMKTISAVALGIAEYGPAFAAWASLVDGDEERLDAFSNHYLGKWPDLNEYAQHMAEEFGWQQALQQLPEGMRDYVKFDYAELAEFLSHQLDIVETSGAIYVFSND